MCTDSYSLMNYIYSDIKPNLEYSDYCEIKKKGLNIGTEAEEKGNERMARNSTGVDTAVGAERENEAIDGERAWGT